MEECEQCKVLKTELHETRIKLLKFMLMNEELSKVASERRECLVKVREELESIRQSIEDQDASPEALLIGFRQIILDLEGDLRYVWGDVEEGK